MINKNDIYEVEIIDIDKRGNGIAKLNNFTLFVANSFLNERLIVKVEKVEKRYAFASIVSIIDASINRIKPVCEVYNKCGGCAFMCSNYDYEKDIKLKYIENLFNIKVDKSYFLNEYNYRNKVSLHVYDGKIGLFSENSHDLVEINNCYLLDSKINDVIKLIKKSNLNNINNIVIRTTSSDIMVIFDNEYDYSELIKMKDITSIYIKDKCVYGAYYITEVINDIKYTIYPDSFFQVNISGMIKLYDIVKEYAGSGKNLLDLYSGTGTIGLYLKDNFDKVTGIEINESSIKNAHLNKKINNALNVEFVLGDSKIASKKDYDVIVVDPPRSGLSKDVINYLNNTNAKVVYVSCNPDTLKRDIELLSNYELKKLSVVNMFPRTKHVESVALLVLK